MIPKVQTALRDDRSRGKRARGAVASILVVMLALVVGGLIGAATPARAATSFTVQLSPLIGTTGNEIPQVTFGGKIGYHLFVENTGDSTTQFASIVVTSDSATFFDTDNPACVVNANNSKQAICTPTGGILAPGSIFEANLRFTAPTTGTQVSTSAAVSIAAQTVGGRKNKGTTLATSSPVLTNLSANGTREDTFLREDESAQTGGLSNTHRQNFGVDLPASLLFDPFGIGVSIHDELGAICTDCLPYHTELTIPAASDVAQAGNPFYNDPELGDPVFNPYGWSMNARYDSNFQIDAVIHENDGGTDETVPACADIGGAPTFANPLCWDSFSPRLQAPGNQKMATATGRGLENGKIGFG